jgi:uncharacterized membrane protein
MTNQLLWALTQLVAGVAVLYAAWVLLNRNVDTFVVLLGIAFVLAAGFWLSITSRSK